jgi:MtN3 and saliva related transmembrane protein
MATAEVIGFCAALLSTLAFVPQVVRTWQMGGREWSWITLAMFGSGVGLWFVYGCLRGAWPLMLANGLTGAQVALIAAVKQRASHTHSRRVTDAPPSLPAPVSPERW